MLELSPEAEQAWRSLRRHLERSERFTLVFLASASPSALSEVRRRLSTTVQTEVSRLDVVEFPSVDATWTERLDQSLEEDPTRVQMRAPLWLALDGEPGDAAMDRLRDHVLASLNEQRTRLEKRFVRPLLIALPSAYLPRIWEVAPDLWTIRAIVASLPAATPSARRLTTASLDSGSEERESQRSEDAHSAPAVAEWRRLASQAAAAPETVSPFVAHIAVEIASGQRQWELARQIAEQGLALARARAESSSSIDRRDDLAQALADHAEVAHALGDIARASQDLQESLEIQATLLREHGDNPSLHRKVAFTLDRVGRLAMVLGRGEIAERAFTAGLSIRRGLLVGHEHDPDALRELSTSLALLGGLFFRLSQLDRAEALLAERVELRRRLVVEDTTSQGELAEALRSLGDVHFEQGKIDLARQAYDEGLVLQREALARGGAGSSGYRRLTVGLARGLTRVAAVASHLGHHRQAEDAAEEALQLVRAVMESEGESPDLLRELSFALLNRGDALRDLGKLDQAHETFSEAVAIRRELVGRSADRLTELEELGDVLHRAGATAHDLGRLDEAELLFSEHLAISREIAKSSSRPTGLLSLANSLSEAGRLASDRGDLRRAEATAVEAVALCRRLQRELGDIPRARDQLAVALQNLGLVKSRLGSSKDAEAAFTECLELARVRHTGDESPLALANLASALNNVALVYKDLGQLDQAEAAFIESIALRRNLLRHLGDHRPALRDLARSLWNLGQVAAMRGDLQRAEQMFAESLDLNRRLAATEEESPTALLELVHALNAVGLVASQRGQRTKAEQIFAESLATQGRLDRANAAGAAVATPRASPSAQKSELPPKS
jgi:tetratricopeptide (TPR) repeat protein